MSKNKGKKGKNANAKLFADMDKILATKTYLSGNAAPGEPDACAFFDFFSVATNPANNKNVNAITRGHENLYRWYSTLVQFNTQKISSWLPKEKQGLVGKKNVMLGGKCKGGAKGGSKGGKKGAQPRQNKSQG